MTTSLLSPPSKRVFLRDDDHGVVAAFDDDAAVVGDHDDFVVAAVDLDVVAVAGDEDMVAEAAGRGAVFEAFGAQVARLAGRAALERSGTSSSGSETLWTPVGDGGLRNICVAL